jgi:hypothetical protein
MFTKHLKISLHIKKNKYKYNFLLVCAYETLLSIQITNKSVTAKFLLIEYKKTVYQTTHIVTGVQYSILHILCYLTIHCKPT